MQGLTRLVGVDTANALGADNLVTFGQPKHMDEEGTMAWMFKALVLGAGGQTMLDSLGAVRDLDASELPWPKLIDNLIKAQGLYSEGTVDKTTGEQYAPPVSGLEAGYKALGFRTASEAEEWEAGGPARAGKEERQERHRRTLLMGKWSSAKQAGDNRGAQRIFNEEVKAWNKAHKDRKMRIDAGDLYKSRRERDRQRKEREKLREEA